MALQADAQPPDTTFGEEQRITVADLVLEIPAAGDAGPTLPPYLVPDDFAVLVDGEPQEVVGVSAWGAGQHPGDGEPWTFVVYVDRSMASPAEVVWGVTELLGVAEDLTALGTVEVLVADPAPRSALAATRDSELVRSILSEMALFPGGEEHEILKLRDELLEALAASQPEVDLPELVRFAAAEERRAVRRHGDAILTALADGVAAGARRAVFLVSGGFDLEIDPFYRPHLAAFPSTDPGDDVATAAEALAGDLEEVGRTLGAYGWLLFPLMPPRPADDPDRGFRIGKWTARPEGQVIEHFDPLDPHNQQARLLFGIGARRDDRRDRERAAAYLELGQSLQDAGELEKAENAYLLALHHFGDDPKTATERAEAFIGLGETFKTQGRRRDAQRVLERARRLDPDRPAVEVGPTASFSAPEAPLQRLAELSGGRLLQSGDALSETLRALPYRVRLTYQYAGLPDGRLHELEVRCGRKKCRAETPGWVRLGTPERVATARARAAWFVDALIEGPLEVKARLRPVAGASRRFRLEADLEVPASLGESDRSQAAFRITLGLGGLDAAATVEHHRHDASLGVVGTWSWSQEILLPEEQNEVAVVLEHLASGLWGTRLVEVPRE